MSVPTPPSTTEPTGPSHAAVAPARNSPSWLLVLMNTAEENVLISGMDTKLAAGTVLEVLQAEQAPGLTPQVGAGGLMQITPDTARFIARRSGATRFTTADLATPQVNIAYGSYYLRYLLDHYGGDKTLALAAYNGGVANVDRWVADARAHEQTLTVSQIPFPETRGYVRKVLNAQRDYRQKYATQLGYR